MKGQYTEQRMESRENWFTRHPVATLMAILCCSFLVILIGFEIFLRTFSGLGNPPLYELSPLYGYRLLGDQVIEPRGGLGFLYASKLTTNNLGLRGADDWNADPAGKILFLGDSVTYGGQYVSDSETFSSVAGELLPEWQVGNGGVNAWGVENIVGLVKDYGFIPAEVIVTCLIEGDFYRGATRASSMPLWIEKPVFALQDLLLHLIWRINQTRYGKNYFKDQEHLDKIVDRAVMRLKSLDHDLEKLNIHHFIFILPTRSQVVSKETPDQRVAQALSRYDIDVHYLTHDLRELKKSENMRREWYRDEVHLEPSGHEVYGELIGKVVAGELIKADL